ncbi:MAG: hypothetical protein NZ872_06755, partial [Archaeoglobaceae archaeon]|nr:hypothetical protein [Archaeoglobaceae archaeon]MDW8128898.1 hypothetical protein [Archaeoglobaceae archaeon]
YAKFLKGAKIVKVERGKVKLKPDLFTGKDVSQFIETVLGVKIEFAKLGEDLLTICTKEDYEPNYTLLRELKELYNVEDVFLFSEKDKNFVVGLYKENRYLGMGLLKAFGNDLMLETAFSDFDLIEIGEMRFDEGKECFIRKL